MTETVQSIKKILLVEDDPIVSYKQASILEDNGYAVVRSINGEKALSVFKKDPDIDYVLMDLELGEGIDGAETALQLQEHRKVPVSFLTAHTEKEYVDKIRSVSNYGYILKNAGKWVLIDAIERGFRQFSETYLLERRVKELFSIYKHLPVMTFCLDDTLHVREMNELALAGTGYEGDIHEAVMIGKVLGCINSGEGSEDCGRGGSCGDCDLRGILEKALHDGNRVHHVSAEMTLDLDGRERKVRLLADVSLIRGKSEKAALLLTLQDTADISGYKEMESAVEELKRENRNLLVEINHRISNNLATVESLAQIELSSGEKSKEEAIADIISRVQAIHIIHDKLYRTEDFRFVDISRYIEDLAGTIASSFHEHNRECTFSFNIEPISLPVKLNTPLGVITAELLTNTFKYAECAGACEIEISIIKAGDSILYRYRDSGTGLKGKVESFDDLDAGTGLLLIRELAAGLEGELTLNTEQGTEFRISFPFPE